MTFRSELPSFRHLDGATNLVEADRKVRGFSSVGRALAWHARGQRFDSAKLHHKPLVVHAARGFPYLPLPTPLDSAETVSMRRQPVRYRRPASKPFTGLWLLVALCLVGVIVLASVGERLPVPEKVTDGAKQVAGYVAPDFFPPTPEQAASEADFRCRVAKVNDGDTLRCQDGTRIRLHAVAARETDNSCSTGHPCPNASAASATAALKRLADNQWLDCMTTGHSYNRVTAICWTSRKVEINCAMIESGTTLIWERFDNETPICRHKRRGLGQALDR